MKKEDFLKTLLSLTNCPSNDTIQEMEDEFGIVLDTMVIPTSDLCYICQYAVKLDEGILVIPCPSVDSHMADNIFEVDSTGERKEVEVVGSINFNLDDAYLLKPEELEDFTKEQIKELEYYKSRILEFTNQVVSV